MERVHRIQGGEEPIERRRLPLRFPVPAGKGPYLVEKEGEFPELLPAEGGPFDLQALELGPHVGRRGGRRRIALGVASEQIGVKLLRTSCRFDPRVRPETEHPIAARGGARPCRDRFENHRELEDGVGVIDGAVLPRGLPWRRRGARIHVGNGFTSGGAGGNEVPAQEANGKPARAGLPRVLRPRMRRYSAFIRAIIFLFAAFSFRLRRSLGFSKC